MEPTKFFWQAIVTITFTGLFVCMDSTSSSVYFLMKTLNQVIILSCFLVVCRLQSRRGGTSEN